MTLTAVYVRVSTDSQNEQGQRREINKWLIGNGFNTANVLWYSDRKSGDNLDRPEFEQLQKDVFAGGIGTIVVYKMDRISRSIKDGVQTLCTWCEHGVRVVSVSQQIDFNGAIGKMIASVLFAVAELEQVNRKERQAAGVAAAKERGVYTGRKLGAIKPGVDLKRVAKLREKGLTNKEIAQALGVSVSSVIRYRQRVEEPATC